MNGNDTMETEHVKEALDALDEVQIDWEFNTIHDPAEDHCTRPPVKTETLGPEEYFACRTCFGYPGTPEDLVAQLADAPVDQSGGQGTLAGWSS